MQDSREKRHSIMDLIESRGPELASQIDLLASFINRWAIDKGFWKQEEELSRLVEIAKSNALISEEDRDYLNGAIKSLVSSTKQMLVITEIAEYVEGLRSTTPDKDCAELGFSNEEVEVADAIIRLLDLAAHRKYRIGDAIMAKMSKNCGRPYQHGRLF